MSFGKSTKRKTIIVLKLSTKERILGKGRMGESYDDVISRALDALDVLAKRRGFDVYFEGVEPLVRVLGYSY